MTKLQSQSSTLATTNETDETDKRFQCVTCAKSYKLMRYLRYHCRWECGKKPTFQCPYCEYCAKRSNSLKKHISRRHAEASQTIWVNLTGNIQKLLRIYSTWLYFFVCRTFTVTIYTIAIFISDIFLYVRKKIIKTLRQNSTSNYFSWSVLYGLCLLSSYGTNCNMGTMTSNNTWTNLSNINFIFYL